MHFLFNLLRIKGLYMFRARYAVVRFVFPQNTYGKETKTSTEKGSQKFRRQEASADNTDGKKKNSFINGALPVEPVSIKLSRQTSSMITKLICKTERHLTILQPCCVVLAGCLKLSLTETGCRGADRLHLAKGRD
jgi:hypothetical protein